MIGNLSLQNVAYLAGVGYTGSIAPYFSTCLDANPNHKVLTASGSGSWNSNTNSTAYPKTHDGVALYLMDTQSGTATLRGRATGFRLWAPTGPNQSKGTFTMTINGGAPITLDQRVANPDGTTNTWPYYTSPTTGLQDYTVVLTFPATGGVYPIYDGIEWLA